MLTTLPSLPSDDELEQRARALLPGVLETIDAQTHRRRNRRRGVAGAGAVTVVALSLLVGATVLAPVFNPGSGTAVDSHNRVLPAAFALDCHGTSPAENIDNQYSDHSEANRGVANLAGTCASLINEARVQDAVNAKAFQLAATGVTCGVINAAGPTAWQWQATKGADGKFAVSTTDGKTVDWPASCGSSVTSVTVPVYAPSAVAVCAVALNWAAVYPSPHQSAAKTCAQHGYSLWNS